MRRKTKWTCILLLLMLVIAAIPCTAMAAVTGDGLEQLFVKLDTGNNGNWYKDSNNESGVLAWDESYVMRSYLEMYEATGKTKYLDKFIVHADSVLKQRDSVRGVKDYRGLSLPAWSAGKRYTGNDTLKIFEVHTALIAYPYARFATIVKNNPALASYQTKASVYLKAAKDAVAVHESQWIVTATEMSMSRPFNMFLSLGQTFLEIYRASGETSYYSKSVKIATHFKNNLNVDSATNSYYWRYMRSGSYTGWEDLSHGALDMNFVVAAFETGAGFTQADMQRFGNTVQKKLIKSTGVIANKVDGTGTCATQGYIGLWMPLYKWSPSLFNTTYQKLSPLTRVDAEQLLGVSFLNKAFSEMNGGTTTPPQDLPPQVTLQEAAGEHFVKENTDLTVKATDDGGVTAVDLSYGTGTAGPWTSIGSTQLASGSAQNGTWTINWNLQALADGKYYVKASVRDEAGHVTEKLFRSFTKDTAAPQVGQYSPGQNTQAPVSAKITVKFNEPVLNVSAGTFTVAGVTGVVSYDTATNSAVFTPSAALAYGKVYTVTLTSGITDRAGNALLPLSWQFKTDPVPPVTSVLKNGNFSAGKTGWSGTQVTVKQQGTNYYGSNSYNWAFFQDVKIQPGSYRLTAQTRKGTAATEARIVVVAIDASGKRTVIGGKTYRHQGTGWENMPAIIFSVPQGTVTTRVYLLTNGGTGYHDFDNVSLTPAV